jgi:hypothetical protein
MVSLNKSPKRNQSSQNGDRRGTVRALLFDQFEELFTSYTERSKERAEFIDQLAEALGDDYLRVVIGVREELCSARCITRALKPSATINWG